MGEDPCQQHRPGQHSGACRTGGCGFCGTDPRITTVGPCRACRQLVCAACDGRYQPHLGPICGPCTPAPLDSATRVNGQQLVRLCVFDLALSCGHLATVALTGWYPVIVACCDRLGGTILRGSYVPFSSDVDYVDVVSEHYEHRPTGTQPPPTRLLGRRPRTDQPYPPSPHTRASTGRFPARVGATSSRDRFPWIGAPRRPIPEQPAASSSTHRRQPAAVPGQSPPAGLAVPTPSGPATAARREVAHLTHCLEEEFAMPLPVAPPGIAPIVPLHPLSADPHGYGSRAHTGRPVSAVGVCLLGSPVEGGRA